MITRGGLVKAGDIGVVHLLGNRYNGRLGIIETVQTVGADLVLTLRFKDRVLGVFNRKFVIIATKTEMAEQNAA